jgi:hypothetical protein
MNANLLTAKILQVERKANKEASLFIFVFPERCVSCLEIQQFERKIE